VDVFVALEARRLLALVDPVVRDLLEALDQEAALSCLLADEPSEFEKSSLGLGAGLAGAVPEPVLEVRQRAGASDLVLTQARAHGVTVTGVDRGMALLSAPQVPGAAGRPPVVRLVLDDWPGADVAASVASVLLAWDEVLAAGRPGSLIPSPDPSWRSAADVAASLSDTHVGRLRAALQQEHRSALTSQVLAHLRVGVYGGPVAASPAAATFGVLLEQADLEHGEQFDDVFSSATGFLETAFEAITTGRFTLDTARSLAGATPRSIDRPIRAEPHGTASVNPVGR
jgi:hypothetical protein